MSESRAIIVEVGRLREVLRFLWQPYAGCERGSLREREAGPAKGTSEYWDDRWRKELGGRFGAHDRVRLPMSPFLWTLDSFDRPTWRRVLVVGCGISTEPTLLAKFGYEVVAIDFSEVAIAHITQHPAKLDELLSWRKSGFDPEQNEHRNFSREEIVRKMESLQSRGSLETRCVDFKDYVADKPFDFIYCPWVWQILTEPDRALLPQRAYEWLAPGGACLVASQNLPSAMSTEQESVFKAAGFFQRSEELLKYLSTTKAPSPKRQSELTKEDEARAHARLSAGEKMWDTFNASG